MPGLFIPSHPKEKNPTYEGRNLVSTLEVRDSLLRFWGGQGQLTHWIFAGSKVRMNPSFFQGRSETSLQSVTVSRSLCTHCCFHRYSLCHYKTISGPEKGWSLSLTALLQLFRRLCFMSWVMVPHLAPRSPLTYFQDLTDLDFWTVADSVITYI